VTLSDGLRLPEAMLEAMRQTFAGKWKAHAAQFQHNLQAFRGKIEIALGPHRLYQQPFNN
jgi:hypothetical protein